MPIARLAREAVLASQDKPMSQPSEEEIFNMYHQLAQAAGVDMSPEMLSVVLELLRNDVTPQGVVALLRQLKDLKLRQAAQEAGNAGAPAPD